MIVLGIMNGTSGDGIDYVWTDIHFDKKLQVKFLKHVSRPFSPALRAAIKKAVLNEAGTYDVGELHHALGRQYADDYAGFRMAGKMKPHIIGLHGQTVYHSGGKATFQIGEPSYLAQTAHAPVIFNFRAADVAMGGQGAPLAPVFHKVLLGEFADKPASFHNLGGISNVTYVYKNKILAFDTGPSCTLIDTWLQYKSNNRQQYDKDGKIAARGVAHGPSVNAFMEHPFLAKKAPKSCGREEFNLKFIKAYADKKFSRLSLEDQLATLTEFTASHIADAYRRLLPETPVKMFCSGGGANNKYLLQRLKIHLPKTEVLTSEDLGWPTSAIEGGAFAVLAYLRLYEQPLDLKSITGSSLPVMLGQICE